MTYGGLTSAEAEERKASGKANGKEAKSPNTYSAIFIRNAATPFNTILIILSVALAICGDIVNAIAASAIIIINICISTIQEARAKHRLDAIAVLIRPVAAVIRDGKEIQVPMEDIVLDDLIHLRAGDQALVDGEVIENRGAELDESLLTGESHTIKKQVGDVIYSGSSCVSGECYFKADKVGEDTFSAKMTAAARKFEKKKTPLQTETNAATEALMVLAFVFLVIATILNIIRGIFSIQGMLTEAIIILDIVPIALFLLITITYMVAAVRMADSGVLLQNSASVESMSHVDTVCMDKTGTITTNKLVFEDAMYFVEEDEAGRMIRELCSTTGSRNRTLTAIEAKYGNTECELLDEIQFSSGRKYSAVRVTDGTNTDSIYMGAWNVLRPHCGQQEKIDGAITAISAQGFRTVVICSGKGAELHSGDEEVIPPLDPVAVISIRDEVRSDCKQILQDFSNGGMDVKVISGDDPDTVEALFVLAEIPGERKRVSGDELAELEGEEFEEKVLETNIFGRMRPEQKEDVIDALRRRGRYVAMVGDGVNDVRSIKKANVGISMETGASAARGVADMVLMKDNFKALPKAILEGKRTVSGMRDILRLYLTRNVVLAFLVFIMLIIFGVSPMIPIQNSLYAGLTVGLPALLLTVMAKPSDNREMILPRIIRYGAPVSVCTVVGAFFVYLSCYYSMQWGYIDADAIVMGMVNSVNSADPGILEYTGWKEAYGTYDKMVALLTDNGAVSLHLTLARGAMYAFLLVCGCLHLLLLFPPIKALSWDGTYGRSPFAMVLMLFLFLLVILVYVGVPWIATCLAEIVCFPARMWFWILVSVVVWYVITLTILKSKPMERLDAWSERLTKRLLDDTGKIEAIKKRVQKNDDQ